MFHFDKPNQRQKLMTDQELQKRVDAFNKSRNVEISCRRYESIIQDNQKSAVLDFNNGWQSCLQDLALKPQTVSTIQPGESYWIRFKTNYMQPWGAWKVMDYYKIKFFSKNLDDATYQIEGPITKPTTTPTEDNT